MKKEDILNWMIEKTPNRISVGYDERGRDTLEFYFYRSHQKRYKVRFYHDQDCCESVYIESIVGELSDLVMEPLSIVEESTNKEEDETNCKSQTWTFYKFANNKCYVDVRWIGESNGYYSESVDVSLEEIK